MLDYALLQKLCTAHGIAGHEDDNVTVRGSINISAMTRRQVKAKAFVNLSPT